MCGLYDRKYYTSHSKIVRCLFHFDPKPKQNILRIDTTRLQHDTKISINVSSYTTTTSYIIIQQILHYKIP